MPKYTNMRKTRITAQKAYKMAVVALKKSATKRHDEIYTEISLKAKQGIFCIDFDVPFIDKEEIINLLEKDGFKVETAIHQKGITTDSINHPLPQTLTISWKTIKGENK